MPFADPNMTLGPNGPGGDVISRRPHPLDSPPPAPAPQAAPQAPQGDLLSLSQPASSSSVGPMASFEAVVPRLQTVKAELDGILQGLPELAPVLEQIQMILTQSIMQALMKSASNPQGGQGGLAPTAGSF